MSHRKTSELISVYLQLYADAPYGKYPEPSPEIIDTLRKNPGESFGVITNDLFEKPKNLDPRDLGAPLCKLLATFVDLVPDLLIPKMTDGFWASRYLYISSTALSKSPIFVSTVINLLTDRSIYIKSLVLELIIRYPHLQTPEAMSKFEKLGKMKSFQNSKINKELLERAIQCVSSKCRLTFINHSR
jgi:hypothetical protein